MEQIRVFQDPLPGGERIVLVLHSVLYGPPGDDVELQLRVPMPMNPRPVELVHDVQVKPDGILRCTAQVQGHEGVVSLNFRYLHTQPLL